MAKGFRRPQAPEAFAACPLLRQTFGQLVKIQVKVFLRMDDRIDIGENELTLDNPARFARFPFNKLIHGEIAKSAGQYTIIMRRRAAALNVA
jgi:hypothetical protein